MAETADPHLDPFLEQLQARRALRRTLRVNGPRPKSIPQGLEPESVPVSIVPSHVKLKRASVTENEGLWNRVFGEQLFTFESMTPYRVRVGWRVIRELARLKNLITDDESLAEGLPGDSWTIKTSFVQDGERTPGTGMPLEACRLASTDGGMSLLPPPVPQHELDENGEPLPTYKPANDPALIRWIRAFDLVAGYLRIAHGSEADEHQGRYGLYGINDPNMTRLLFPSKSEILAWEEIVIDETTLALVRSGQLGARRIMRMRYGLVGVELDALIKTARVRALKQQSGSIEEDRALIALKLESLARRAKRGFDMRAELGALKQLTVVLGLSKTEPEDVMREFAKIVKKVSGGSNTQIVRTVDTHAVPQLTEGAARAEIEAIEAEIMEDEKPQYAEES